MTEKARTRRRRGRPAGKLKSERIQEALPRIEITVGERAGQPIEPAPEGELVTLEIGYREER